MAPGAVEEPGVEAAAIDVAPAGELPAEVVDTEPAEPQAPAGDLPAAEPAAERPPPEDGKKVDKKLPKPRTKLHKSDALAVYDSLKDRAAVALIVVCFMEFAGSTVPSVSNPYLFLTPENSPAGIHQDTVNGGWGRYANFTKEVGYSVAVNAGPSAFYFGQGLFTTFAGCLIGSFGFRNTMLICCLVSGGAYFGIWAFSYWELKVVFNDMVPFDVDEPSSDPEHWWHMDVDAYIFLAFRFLAGLFAGCMPLTRRYLKDIFGDRWEGDWWFSVTAVAILPAAIAAPIVADKTINGKSDENDQEFFMPYVVGGCCYAFAVFVIVFFVPRVPPEDWKKVQGDWEQQRQRREAKLKEREEKEAKEAKKKAKKDKAKEAKEAKKAKKKGDGAPAEEEPGEPVVEEPGAPAVPAGDIEDPAAKEKKPAKKPRGHSKWVWWFWFARFLADVGVGHFTHLQVVGVYKHDWFRDDMRYSMTISAAATAALMAVPLGVILGSSWGAPRNKACGSLWAAVLGQLVAGGALYCLGIAEDATYYLVLLMGVSWGNALSKSQAPQVLMDLVPPEQEDWWLSRMSLVQAISIACAPFPLCHLVLEKEGWGPYPGGCTAGDPGCFFGNLSSDAYSEDLYLLCCAIASGASALMHVVMLMKVRGCCCGGNNKVGNRPPEEVEAMNEYNVTRDPRWLPGDVLLDLNLKRLEDNMPLLRHRFGDFEDDKEHLHRIQTSGQRDMKFWLSMVPQWVQDWDYGDDDERANLRLMLLNSQRSYYMTDDERDEFADWMVDWLQFAGYGNPAQNPMCWKAMIMKRFPFVVESGISNDDFLEEPTPIWLKYMKVMQDNMGLDDKNDRARHSLSLMGRGYAGSVLRLPAVY